MVIKLANSVVLNDTFSDVPLPMKNITIIGRFKNVEGWQKPPKSQGLNLIRCTTVSFLRVLNIILMTYFLASSIIN